jgi:hypothetical protein
MPNYHATRDILHFGKKYGHLQVQIDEAMVRNDWFRTQVVDELMKLAVAANDPRFINCPTDPRDRSTQLVTL